MATGKPSSKILICTATIAAAAPVGDSDNVTLTDDPSVPGVIRLSVPAGQTWVIEDLYIALPANAGTTSPLVEISLDGGNVLGTTPPLAGLLISNPSRPTYSNRKFGFRGGQVIRMRTIVTILNDATADSISFICKIKIT